MKHKDVSYSLANKLVSNFTHHATGKYVDGYVMTPHGIVLCYAEKDRGGFTELRFVSGGSLHKRAFKSFLTKRGMATKARQFAFDVFRRSRW